MRPSPIFRFDELHRRTVAGNFNTGRDLKDFPTAKLEGQKLAVLGYGNIGREVAKLAKAFGMRVSVYPHEPHKDWIEAEGFEYADSPVLAAIDANVLSVHVGLGRLDPSTGKFSNVGLINHEVLSKLADGSVLVNYDRGELVDIDALDAALLAGKVGYASNDADIFNDANSGTLRVPVTFHLIGFFLTLCGSPAVSDGVAIGGYANENEMVTRPPGRPPVLWPSRPTISPTLLVRRA